MSTFSHALWRALHRGPTDAHDDLHFHLGGDGRPFACDVHRCESPGLSAEEVGAAG